MCTSEMDVDSSSKFIASLTKFLQSLCNGYVDFENGVELVGHIYLSVDTGKKIDYILHEKVCKNDENSVTFISNSFHAQPFDKTKSQTKQQVDTSKGKTRSDKVRDVDKEETIGRKDDDEDVVIVNATKGALENSDGASMGTRGRKRPASPNSEQQFQRPFRRNAEASLSSPSSSAQQTGQSGSGVLGSNGLRRKAPPSATITSQEDQTDSFSSSDLKLEHMTTDELLSLASQVSDSSCSASIIPPNTGSGSRSAGGDPSNQQVWVKQEAPDDDDSCLASGSGDSAHGQSWPLGRDPQNDTNSGSGGLYPVMLHQNTAAFPGPGGPFPAGFPPLSGGPSSSQHPAFTQQSSSQAAANLFANPVPGTSQGGGAVDSADVFPKSEFNNQVQTPPATVASYRLQPSTAAASQSGTVRANVQSDPFPFSQQVNAHAARGAQSQRLAAISGRDLNSWGSATCADDPLPVRNYRCATCRIAFTTKYDLFRHGKNCRNRRPVVCRECGEAFSSISSLKDHVQAKHSGQVYACLCGRVFNWRPSYYRHRRTCSKHLS